MSSGQRGPERPASSLLGAQGEGGLVDRRLELLRVEFGLVRDLRDLSRAQSEFGQHREALASASACVAHCRALRAGGAPVELDLALCLDSLASLQNRCDRSEEALLSLQEAAELLWPLFLSSPRQGVVHVEQVLLNLYSQYERLAAPPPLDLIQKLSVARAASAVR